MNNLSNVSEIELTYTPNFKASERPLITDSKTANLLLQGHWDKGLIQFIEEFKIILLNNANRVLGIADIGLGGKDAVIVDLRTIFSIALKASASKIILSHNHPSGKLFPSPQDKEITDKAAQAGKLLNIQVIDHLIIGDDDYYSFADNNYL